MIFTLIFCFNLEAQQLISSTPIGNLTKSAISATYGNDAEYGVKLYKVLYETPDIHGVLDTASGLFVVPDVTANTYPLLCYQHGTVSGRTDVPSNLEGGSALAIVFGSMGYFTSAADYLGLGEARGIHPYVHADTEASAAIDMMYAARQFAALNDVLLNDQVFITGYSQGGHAAMAAHRELEANFTNDFTVTAAAPMSGPYSISEKMTEFTLGDDPYFFVAYLASVALSYNEAYGTLYENLDEFFKPQFAGHIQSYANEEINLFTLNFLLIGQLNLLGGSFPKLMLQDSILESLLNDPTHPASVALAANDVYDWTPQAPTRLYYCDADDQVFFENSTLAEEVMNANGASDLEAISVGASLDHGGCVDPAVTATIDFFAGFQQITTNVSVIDEVGAAFQLQPNPAGDELWITTNDAELQHFQYRLLDGNGRLLINQEVNGTDRTALDVSAFSSGIYFMNIITEKGSTTKKLIVK